MATITRVEYMQGPVDQVKMAVGQGIKGSGINTDYVCRERSLRVCLPDRFGSHCWQCVRLRVYGMAVRTLPATGFGLTVILNFAFFSKQENVFFH